MPRRRPELPLISPLRTGTVLFLVLLGTAALPFSAASQEDGAGERNSDDRIRAFLEGGVAATRFRDVTTPAFFGSLGIHLSPSFTLGGAAFLLPAAVDIGRVAFQDIDLLVGYAGLSADWEHAPWSPGGPWRVFGSFLAGAGNADVRDAATAVNLASDNFLVLRPGGGVVFRLDSRLDARLGASYRWVAGVEDLVGLTAADLRGGAFFLGLRLSGL